MPELGKCKYMLRCLGGGNVCGALAAVRCPLPTLRIWQRNCTAVSERLITSNDSCEWELQLAAALMS